MCFVSHSPEDSSEPDSEATETQGALVTVSSTGSVNAWGVTQPSMADCEEAGTSGSDASELDLPLLVSCVVKVSITCGRGSPEGLVVIHMGVTLA